MIERVENEKTLRKKIIVKINKKKKEEIVNMDQRKMCKRDEDQKSK